MRIKLDIPLTTKEIAAATNGKSCNNQRITNIVTDSREAEAGDLFIALNGEHFNGEEFINDIVAKGAIPFSTLNNEAGITVSNTKSGLLMLAKFYKRKLTKLNKTIAITGSVGKTTTKEFLKVILSTAYKVHATAGNLNNEIGMPLTVLSAKADTEMLILEMGMNHVGEIKEMAIAVSPDIAIITKIGTAHIGNLGSREAIALAKLEVTYGMKNDTLIVPFEEDLIPYKDTNISFSSSNNKADYYIKSAEKYKTSIFEQGNMLIEQPLLFSANHLNECLAAAIACSRKIGMSVSDINRGISLISNDNLRQSLVIKGNYTFLCDCYNASLESVLADIDMMKQIKGYNSKSLVLGELLELGDLSAKIHRKIGKSISPFDFSFLFLIGHHTKNIMDGAISIGFPRNRILFNPYINNHAITANHIKINSVDGELLLLKGSRKVRMEQILNFF